MKTILLGVTSGIAAFKTLELIKLLRKESIEVHVIMTAKAKFIVSEKDLEKASGNKVYTELFEKNFDYKAILTKRKVDHIALADSADLMVIAPATANIIAKLAHGMADDFLTTTALAMTRPILLCPSMNVHMWQHPIVKENIAKLQSLDYHIIRPASGMLACGYEGEGKLEEIVKIKDEIVSQLRQTARLKGRKIMITSGGTKEKIDDVRFITNRSSGKMGAALADVCHKQGADVLLLRATDAMKPRYSISEETFTTAEDLKERIRKHAKQYDVIFHAAAVSDFKIEENKTGKLSSAEEHTLKLVPQPKIIDQIKQWNPSIKLIGFKATAGLSEKKMLIKAKQKLTLAKADAVIANDAAAFDNDSNEVYVITHDGSVNKIPLDSKQTISEKIIASLKFLQ